MTLPALLWRHVHVSEREVAHTWPDGRKDDSHWEDCLWASTTEFLNDTYTDVPDTLTYAEKLRAASGDSVLGGSNFTDVAKAFAKLAINVAVQALTFAAFWNSLKPGTGAVATGSMGNFPAGHTLRRWDPTFAGGHAVYVARVDSQDRVWWCDPLAPKGTYEGQWVTKAQLKQFMGSTWTGITRPLIVKPAPVPAPKEDAMPALITYMPGYVASLKGDKNVRSEPVVSDATKVRVTKAAGEKVSIVGTVKGVIPVGLTSSTWVVWYESGKPVYIHDSNVTLIVPPITGITQAELDAAKANAAAERARADAAEATAATATVDERNRLANAEAARLRAL